MDYGESESVILYKELDADFLLLDDKKARKIAENFDITCIGTLGILSVAKSKELIKDLRPIFLSLLKNNRYYSLKLLNKLLKIHNELAIENKA
jgi:predicted nucleic acid-binding protein